MKTAYFRRRSPWATALRAPLGIVLLGFLVLGCAWASGGRRAKGTTDWDVLSRADLRTFQQLDTYQAIQQLRPSWLRGRVSESIIRLTDPSGQSRVRVHVDGVPLSEGLAVLSRIPAMNVQEVRHLDPADATTRFGTGYSDGVILVVTRSGGGGLGAPERSWPFLFGS